MNLFQARDMQPNIKNLKYFNLVENILFPYISSLKN